MIFGPVDDKRIELPDGLYVIIKSPDTNPNKVVPEIESGLYKNGKLLYQLPFKGSHFHNYIVDGTGMHVVVINQIANSPTSLTFYNSGVVVNHIKYNDLGVPISFIPVSSSGWVQYWGGYENRDGDFYNVCIDKTSFHIAKFNTPLTGNGNIRIDLKADSFTIDRPFNFIPIYSAVLLLFFFLWILVSFVRRKATN